MQVKRYEAENIQEALAKIKKDLGPEAIVLSAKRMPGEKQLMEIVAASDDNHQRAAGLSVGDAAGRDERSFSPAGGEGFSYLKKELQELKELVRGVSKENLSGEFAELKDSMQAFFDVLGLQGRREEKSSLSRIYHYLVGQGVSKARACRLLDRMKRSCPGGKIPDYESCLKIAEGIIRETFVKKSGKQEKRVKVFIGPTGVGKTTTLAKLAARYSLEQKLKVGLVTMDTYRIAALEQLKIYARIMDLPLEVATQRDVFGQVLERFSDRDIILVDTPGKGPVEAGYFTGLQEILADAREVETNLLLSLTSSRENMLDVVARFGKFPGEQIIFTKADEGTRCGFLYDVIEQAGRPVAYVTTGQNVPQDIETADPARLAELIMRH